MTTEPSAELVRTRDGRELYVERHGSGTPVVVFEAGMGASRSSWGAVVPLVAARTTAVIYDRSGLGRSPRDAEPRVLARLVDDLADVLDHLGDGPFVLVGHSWGGPIIRSISPRIVDRLLGLVLVDQTDETCELFFSPAAERQTRWSRPFMVGAARIGLVRMGVKRLAASLPEPTATDMITEDGTVDAMRTMQAELAASITDLRRLRDEPIAVPDEVALTVISGTKRTFIERNRRPELIAAHQARADAHPRGRHVNADGSSHYVPFTEPQLIADEIFRILDLAES